MKGKGGSGMCGNIGGCEMLLMIPLGLIGLGIPIATVIGVFLVYGKVKRIEKKLTQSDES